jgi:Domain of unknown function (DUF5103)
MMNRKVVKIALAYGVYFKHSLLAMLLLCCFITVYGQKGGNYNYYDDENRPQTDRIYRDNIKTVMFYNASVINSPPVMQYGTSEKLTLRFDELGSRNRDYQYTIIHCDANWQPSQLIKSEFIDGMFTEYLSSYVTATNTYKSYVHYQLDFPTASMRPKLSGNYILKIFLDNEKNAIITKRFYVYENKVNVSGEVLRPTMPKYMDAKQLVNFSVDMANANIADPFRDIKVVVRQNNRTDNEIRDLKPRLIQDKSLIYNYDEELLFDGGNEFRPVDVREATFKGMGVRFFTLDTTYHAVLFGDEERASSAYSKFVDQDGNYSIIDRNNQASFTTSDYVHVYFKLKGMTYDDRQDVYVFGALTNWQIDKNFKLNYIPRDGEYQGHAMLKMGYYDYEYVTVNANGEISTINTEGNHWETENNYSIFVYHRPTGQNFDLLVGRGVFNSGIK